MSHKKTIKHYYFIGLLGLLGLSTSPLVASPEGQLVLVGVIAGGGRGSAASQDTAILKDVGSKRSIVVRKGEALKDFPGYTVLSIDRKKVVLQGSDRRISLTHETFPSDTVVAKAGEFEPMPMDDGFSGEPYSGGGGELPPPPLPPETLGFPGSNPYPNDFDNKAQPLVPLGNGNLPPLPQGPPQEVEMFHDEEMPVYTETFY